MKEIRVKYNKYDSGNIFLLSLLSPSMVMIVVMLVTTLFGVSGSFFGEVSVGYSILSSIIIQGSFIGLFFVYNKLKNIKICYANNFTFNLGLKNYITLILITLISVIGMSYFLTIFDEFFEFIGYTQNTDLPLPLDNFGWYALSVLLLAVLPSIGEELLFRGIIFSGLKQYGNKIAIIGSALLFALIHSSPIQTVYPFLFGLILSISVYKTNSLFASIFIHFLNNFIVVTIAYIRVIAGFNLLPTISGNLSLLWCALIGATAFGIICFLIRMLKSCKIKSKIDINQTQEEIKILNEGQSTGANKTLWYGVIAGCILWLIVLIGNF